MLATPAGARMNHRAVYPRVFDGAYSRPASRVPNFGSPRAHTGYPYSGPYNERIVTSPNGIVLGTDPDANIRAQMRRDGIGPNGSPSSGGSM